MSKIFKALTFAMLLSCFSFASFAMTPKEYCQIHEDAKAPGTCVAKGDCAVLTTNLGTEECKLCGEGGCEMVDCKDCSK